MSVAIDPFYLSVSRITTFSIDTSHEEECSFGTGFFYTSARGDSFLITNRHVVRDEKKGLFPNTARIVLHVNSMDLTQNITYDIPLYKGAKALWKEPEPKTADVVAIPLDSKDLKQKSCYLQSFAASNLLPEDYLLEIGEDVMIMGYPLEGYYDDVNNLPLLRHGMISSAYGVWYKKQPYFVIDSRLHKGTSGSPVITKSKSLWKRKSTGKPVLGLGGTEAFLLGVNASTGILPPEEKEPVSLNAVVYISIVDDMVNNPQ